MQIPVNEVMPLQEDASTWKVVGFYPGTRKDFFILLENLC